MLSQEVKEVKIEKWRDRTFMLLLYPEDTSHLNAIEKIKQSYDYAIILHDKDVTEDGEIKKPHYHVVLRFTNQKWNTAIAKDLGITYNYIRKVDRFNQALEYLVHLNDVDKFQYDISEVKGTLSNKVKELVNVCNKSEGEKVIELIEYIENHSGKIRLKEFSLYCAKSGYWAEFRRSASIFIKIIDEHNMLISDDLQ